MFLLPLQPLNSRKERERAQLREIRIMPGVGVPTRLTPSASFKSTTARDTYLRGVKTAAHDVNSPDIKTPEPKGGGASSCFRSSSPSHVAALHPKRFVDVNYALPSDFDPKPTTRSASAGSASFRSRCGRDAYIKGTPQPTSTVYYDIPGMADALKQKKSGAGIMKGSGGRDSFMKEFKGRFGESSAHVKGMGEEAVAKRSTTPKSAAFRGSPGTGRDSYLKDTRCRSTSPAPPLPGIADEIVSSPRGKFRGGSGKRDSYLQGARHFNDLTYDLPGMAEKPSSVIATKSCFRGRSESRDSYVKAQRQARTDLVYDVPGMGDSSRRSSTPCSANSSFRSTSKRGDYASRSPKPTDLHYELPGMASQIMNSPRGKFSSHGTGGRDSHIKAQRQFVDVVYDLPGMAEMCGSFVASPEPSMVTPTKRRTSIGSGTSASRGRGV